jgi:hypothetical protein
MFSCYAIRADLQSFRLSSLLRGYQVLYSVLTPCMNSSIQMNHATPLRTTSSFVDARTKEEGAIDQGE